ncbi:MAG: hypothetical protein LKJ88_05080 [Bacilli bacterium]|jgi:hypothetical protein|nr:hypothetical protein [Bacilli bacterium]
MSNVSAKPNANEIAGQWVHQMEVVAMLKATSDNVEKGYRTDFALHMQVLVTKVASIVSECVYAPKFSSGLYCNAIVYLCKRVLGDSGLYSAVLSDGINLKGNKVKHVLKATPKVVNIQQTVSHYNELLSELVNRLHINALNDMKIRSFFHSSAQGNNGQSRNDQHASFSQHSSRNQQRKTATISTATGLTLSCSFVPQEGLIEKGWINKKKFVRFGFKVNINSRGYKVKSIKGVVKCSGHSQPLGNLHTGLNVREVEQTVLRTNQFSIVVSVVYKISLFTSKTQTATILGTY